MSAHDVLPDLLSAGLKVVFCGTAAGRKSAATQWYYAHPQNQFWRTLAAVGLTPRQLQPHEYRQLLSYGLGLTDLAKHHSGMDNAIPEDAYDPVSFQANIQRYQPQAVAFTSKKTAQVYFGRPVMYGIQDEQIGTTRLFVLPSPSPAARSSWDVAYWHALERLVTR